MDTVQDEIEKLRLKCIGCGKCRKVCPSYKHGGCDPMEIMMGSLENVTSCITCGTCSAVCRRTDPYIVMKDLLSIVKNAHVSDYYRETGYAFTKNGEVPGDDLDPEWDGDDVYVMPGCVIKAKAPFIQRASRAAMDSIGLKSSERPGNTCCMHPVMFREMHEKERRDVKSAMGVQANGRKIITLCGGCSSELQSASVDADHIIPFLYEHIDALPRFEKPLKVALEPGCEGMQYMKQLRELVVALGCEPIDNETGCCGKMTDVAGPLLEERERECEGADVIVVGCPMCFVKYDSQPGGIPVVHMAELVAMAAGDYESTRYHRIPVPGN